MSDADRLVSDLLRSRVGLGLLAHAEGTGRVEAVASDLGTAHCLAATAFADTSPFVDEGLGAWLAGRADGLRPVAERLVEAAGGVPEGWSAPVDTQVQRWAGTSSPMAPRRGLDLQHDRPTTAEARGGPWEAYAQLPTRWVVTDGEVRDAVGRQRSGSDEWDAHGLWDAAVAAASDVHRWRIEAAVQVAVVDGPDDWAELCARYPGPAVDPGGVSLAWDALAEDLDGVHLTLRGLVTGTRPVDVDRAASRLWAWGSTGTRWSRPVPFVELDRGEVLPSSAHEQARGSFPTDAHVGTWDPRFDEGDEVDGSELA